jgi:deoxyribodipyrimidine photo-lyase
MHYSSANRKAALEILRNFLPKAGTDYSLNRNYDLGPENRSNVSTLSSFLRRRLIHERELIEAVLNMHGHEQASKFIQEVLWRTYWGGYLAQRPSIWESYKLTLLKARVLLTKDNALATQYSKAITGSTGIDCFDAWSLELISHGYLHNHARMWFASIWIYTLNLPWELGADFLFKNLIDADPASNTLSWRWVAGLHTKGKNYLVSNKNIHEFTKGRFGQEEQINGSTGLHLTEAVEFIQEALPSSDKITSEDIVVLIHPDHCLLESFDGLISPKCVISISDFPEPIFAYERSSRALKCDHDAVADAAARAASHYKCPHLIVELAQIPSLKYKEIVTARPRVGPIAESIALLRQILEVSNIRLASIDDNWDRDLFPFAGKGFFDFYKKAKIHL